jgi:hypothetical protein
MHSELQLQASTQLHAVAALLQGRSLKVANGKLSARARNPVLVVQPVVHSLP